MLARSFSFTTDAKQTLVKQAERRTIPLTFFLQAFFVASITVVLMSIVLVLVSFVNETKPSVSSRLLTQQAQSSVHVFGDQVEGAIGAHEYIRGSVRSVPLGSGAEAGRAVPLFRSWLRDDPTMQALLLCGARVVVLATADDQILSFERLSTSSVAVSKYVGGVLQTTLVLRFSEVIGRDALLPYCFRSWQGNTPNETLPGLIISNNSALLSFVPAVPLDATETLQFVVASELQTVADGRVRIIATRRVPDKMHLHANVDFDAPMYIIDLQTNHIIAATVANLSVTTAATLRNESSGGVLSQWRPQYEHGFAVLAHLDEESLFRDLLRGSRLMVLIAVTIGVLVSAAGSLFVHVIIRPMVHLANDMNLVGKLEVSEVAERSSIFREIDDMAHLFSQVTAKARILRDLLPAEEEAAASDDDIDLSATDAGTFTLGELALCESMNVRTVRVHVSYESRSQAKEVGAADFDFVYAEGESDLFERLCLECKQAVGENEFQAVQMTHVSAENEHTVLHTSLFLQEILSTSPKCLRLIMQKSSTPVIGALLTGAADAFNVVATIAFVGRLLDAGIERGAAIPFVCIYIFSLGMNLMLSVVLLRSGNERFMRWAAQSGAEVVITLVLSTLSPQNLQLLFSNIKIGESCLLFNAPPDDPMLQKSLSWSLFGFLFSDVMQLLFKIWITYNSPSVEFLYILALISSGASVAFNLLFKMHAMLLWHNTTIQQGDATDGFGEEGHLVSKDSTLVLCHFVVPKYVRQLSLRAVELNAFYSTALSLARKYHGTPLVLHGGSVLIGFNLNARLPSHVNDAMFFAARLSQMVAQRGQHASSAITTGSFPTGMLGSLNSKVLHCIGPVRALHSMVRVATILQQRILVAPSVMEALNVPMRALPVGVTKRILVRCPSESGSVGSAQAGEEVFVVCLPRQLLGNMPIVRRGHNLLQAVVVGLAGDEVPVDIAAAQLSAACGLLQLDRGELESRVQQLAAAHHSWLEAQRSVVTVSTAGGYAVALMSDKVLGRGERSSGVASGDASAVK